MLAKIRQTELARCSPKAYEVLRVLFLKEPKIDCKPTYGLFMRLRDSDSHVYTCKEARKATFSRAAGMLHVCVVRLATIVVIASF